MKKIYLLLITLLWAINFCRAQWTISGANIYNSNSGNVGIGTTNPLTIFDVKLTTNQHIQFAQNVNGAYSGASGIVCINDGNTAYTPLGFYASNYYFGNGNVGIGTTSASVPLHVVGNSTFYGTNGYFTTKIGATASGDSYLYLGSLAGVPAIQGNNDAFSSPQNLLLQSQGGNVGIGTTTPASKLSVLASDADPAVSSSQSIAIAGGSGKTTAIGANTTYGWLQSYSAPLYINSAGNNTIINPTSGSVGIGTTSPEQLFTLSQSSNYTTMGFYNTNAAAANRNWAIGSNDQTYGDFAIRTSTALGGNPISAGAVRFYIDPSGDAGIGTTNTHGYKFAVNGSAIATSMTVQLYANWPDYVFKKDYRLPSLTDVKAYIDANHHLPEMPSEQEVAKNGLNLGEMNRLLAKKVEELTLYLVEKDKQIEHQQEINKSVQKELNELKSQVLALINSKK